MGSKAVLLFLIGCAGGGPRSRDSGAQRAGSESWTPLDVCSLEPGALTGQRAIEVAAGRAHACALLEDGQVACWGEHGAQLGMRDASSQPRGPAIVPCLHDVLRVHAALDYTCALQKGGARRCWGGRPDATFPPLATRASGDGFTCEVVAGGGVTCRGRNDRAQLGGGPARLYRPTVEPIAGVSGARAVASRNGEGCAALRDGRVVCWNRRYEETGRMVTELHEVSGVSPAVAVTADDRRMCAVTSDGQTWCWPESPRLGPAAIVQTLGPVLSLGGPGLRYGVGTNGHVRFDRGGQTEEVALPQKALQVAGSGARICARTEGEVHCWTSETEPRTIPGSAGSRDISLFDSQLCVATRTGDVFCDNGSGEWEVPDLHDIVDLEVSSGTGGHDLRCALSSSGKVSCWGSVHQRAWWQREGTISDGFSILEIPAPQTVVDLPPAVAIGGGENGFCAVLRDAGVACWDHSGIGFGFDSEEPVRVRGIGPPPLP